MYLVGRLYRAHGSEPPQWDIVALRMRLTRAIKDCQDERHFYIKLGLGLLRDGSEAVWPRRA